MSSIFVIIAFVVLIGAILLSAYESMHISD